MADVNLKFTKPELQIVINRDKANLLGVSTQNIGQTLQLALSGQRFGYFIMNGKQYEILGELARMTATNRLILSRCMFETTSGTNGPARQFCHPAGINRSSAVIQV
jgi:multidrug efflux pump